MRLIDADALIEFIGKVRAKYDFFTDEERPRYEAHSKALELLNIYLDHAPTIDAVEVVRCKDCKDIFFDDWYKCFSCANLYGLNEEVKPDDYCSHGERKESE